MRASSVLVLAVLATISTAAQERAARDPQIEAIAADARAAPAEFAADVLLRLAASPNVVEPKWRRELVEEAFLLAYSAPEPYRQLAVSIPIDSRQSAQARASDTALTRVSLQVRAAQLMAFVDRGARAGDHPSRQDFGNLAKNARLPHSHSHDSL